jgi:uncharacterized membrane protein YjfL (UPF0719 family)
MNIESYLSYFVYALIYLGLVVLMKFILNLKTASLYSASDEISSGNIAVGLRRSGAQLGLAIAMIGVLSGGLSKNFTYDIMLTAGYGLLAVLFMLTSLILSNLLIKRVDNSEALKNNNVAVGFVEFGTLVMTGIIAYAAIKGDSGGVLSSIIYFIIGQLTIYLLVKLYQHVLSKKHMPVEKIIQGNVSAGVYVSGKIIAYGLILQSAIVGNSQSTTLEAQALEYVVAALAGLFMLYIFEKLIDWLIITSTTVTDILQHDKAAAAVQLALAEIGMAAILGIAIL